MSNLLVPGPGNSELGLRRLNPATAGLEVVQNWTLLFEIVVGALCHTVGRNPYDELAELVASFDITATDHPLMAKASETTMQVISRHQAARSKVSLPLASLRCSNGLIDLARAL